MQKTEEKNTSNELEEKSTNKEELKTWITPELKVLPVPTRTQTGGGVQGTENTFYSS